MSSDNTFWHFSVSNVATRDVDGYCGAGSNAIASDRGKVAAKTLPIGVLGGKGFASFELHSHIVAEACRLTSFHRYLDR